MVSGNESSFLIFSELAILSMTISVQSGAIAPYITLYQIGCHVCATGQYFIPRQNTHILTKSAENLATCLVLLVITTNIQTCAQFAHVCTQIVTSLVTVIAVGFLRHHILSYHLYLTCPHEYVCHCFRAM